MNRIELGDVAKDTISGFEGVVVAETQWLHGCRRITLQPREMRDGKPIEQCSFDEPQLQLVSKGYSLPTDDTGGPRPEPRRAAVPAR